MNRIIQLLLCFVVLFSCKKEDTNDSIGRKGNQNFISAVDISSYPEISNTNPTFYDLNGNKKDFLLILKENGVNTVRLRLWVNPINEHSGFNEVKQFSKELRDKGFKIWLTIHYSDTWADPANQKIPSQWKNHSFTSLKDKVYDYTKRVVREMNPDFIQIGNEINSGILHPYGKVGTNNSNFIDLIKVGCLAVRENSSNCKIILHYAGIEKSNWFFNQVKSVDYDIIGLSYYPIWHGKSLSALQLKIQDLSHSYGKKILIAETAYPFILKWNDLTNNIVGKQEQLILPNYTASPEGQRKFIRDIKKVINKVDSGIGFCYWGAELIAWKGKQATNASSWENQALFDFNNKALPVLNEFENK